MQNGGESLVPLNKYVVSAPKSGVLRLPIDTNVDLLLQQLINLPEHPDPFSLPYITTHLLLLLPQQLQASSINDHDISGSMMVFIAENIQMPVPWLLAQLQEKFSMNRRRAKGKGVPAEYKFIKDATPCQYTQFSERATPHVGPAVAGL